MKPIMHVIADLQLHSRFSRAVSKQMNIPYLADWAKRKGIGVVATGDWTHPIWFRELQENLEEIGNGLLRVKGRNYAEIATAGDGFPRKGAEPLFLLATEVSCIYSQGGKVRRVHTLIWVPSLESAGKINQELTKRGCNLMSDGRPIIGLASIQVAELVFGIEPKALIIPAHSWTPWFAIFGSMSGFDSVAEAFGPYADRIYAIETGLSSNPAMNWRIPELDSRAIVSFSDAHSGAKLGREATVFEIPEGKLSYESIYEAIAKPTEHARIAYTIEFYPEEGKYHFTGHRVCKVRQNPEETKSLGTTCPVCGKALTIGVMHRVEDLAKRSEADLDMTTTLDASSSMKVVMHKSVSLPHRPPFVMMVPLLEILAEALETSSSSKKVQLQYSRLTDEVGSEFFILFSADLSDIAKVAGSRVVSAIERVRQGKLHIDPGYDGEFGVVTIWPKNEEGIAQRDSAQLSLLS